MPLTDGFIAISSVLCGVDFKDTAVPSTLGLAGPWSMSSLRSLGHLETTTIMGCAGNLTKTWHSRWACRLSPSDQG